MNNKELYKLIQTVQKNIRCPQCGKEYLFSKIRIKGIMDKIVFIELSCTTHMPVLATVSIAGKEIHDKIIKNKITNDDVLDIYETLQKFNGDFEKIFKNNK